MDDMDKLLGDNEMIVKSFKRIEKPAIKIEKTEDYYNFFVAMLRTEGYELRFMEHLWILGISDDFYSKCAYLVGYGTNICFNYATDELFSTTIHHCCKKIIMGHNKSTYNNIEITEQDIAFANSVYHRAKFLGIELYDYIILNSNSHTTDKTDKPVYGSLREKHLVDEVLAKDISYTPYIELKEQIDEEKAQERLEGREEGREEGQQKRNIEIAIKMLSKNKSIEEIVEFTDLTVEQIEKIKSGM